MAYTVSGITATGTDIMNALRKRLNTQGLSPTEPQLLTLMIDVMNVINADSANVLSHATTELGHNKVRPFDPHS